MTYVIAEPCIDVLDISCVSVCPVDCIHYEEGVDRKLFIDPNECIDCGACVPECPVEAIFDETQLPDDKKQWITTNAEKSTGLPVINSKQDPFPGADERKEKLGF